jgi:ABC-2 type transport system permease protein
MEIQDKKIEFWIITSTEDQASQTIREFLIENYPFEKADNPNDQWRLWQESPTYLLNFNKTDLFKEISSFYQFINIRIVQTDKRMVFIDENLTEDQLNSTFGGHFIIFASRHRSQTEIPAILTHTTGNWTEDISHGGSACKIAHTSALLLGYAYRNLLQQQFSLNLDWPVDLEVNHHGPTNINRPIIFMELGSSDANYRNKLGACAVGNAIIQTFVKNQNQNVQKPYIVDIQQRIFYNEEQKSSYLFVPGTIAVILLLICAMLTSISITREKEFGSMSILLISPLKPIHIIIGKVTPYFVLSFLIASAVLAIGHFVFQVPIKGSLVLLFAETLLYMFLSLSIGIFISIVAKNQQFAMFMSMLGLMLPSILLSGFIFPIENMPIWLQALCQIAPPKWFIEIIRGIMLKGVGMQIIWKQTLVLVAMTVFFIAMSVKRFKIREL